MSKFQEPSQAPETIDQILTERGTRYGKFKNHAEITQNLYNLSRKFVLDTHHCELDGKLTSSQAEALHMIFHKIGRILNGDPDYADSWVDIAGYAQLIADELNGKVR